MAIYSKPSKLMVIDLINAGNPNLPFKINETDFELLDLTAIDTLPNGHNTSIRLVAKPNTNYVGNLILTYRRLNIANIFRNLVPTIDYWVPNTGANSTQLTTSTELHPKLGDKYGFLFESGMWNNVLLSGYHGVRGDAFAITALPGNWAFVGTISAKWNIGQQSLESLLSIDQIPGRLYPGGNDFTTLEDRRYWITPDGFDVDYSKYSAQFVALESALGVNGATTGYIYMGSTSSGYLTSLNTLKAIVQGIKNREGDNYIVRGGLQADLAVEGIKYDMTGTLIRNYRLPHADVPEANSEFYNRCIVLDTDLLTVYYPTAAKTWGTGRMILHYNI